MPRKPKHDRITIKQRNPEQLFAGPNVIVELNGHPLSGVTGLKIECQATSVGRVTLEMICELDELRLNSQPIFELGKYHPVLIRGEKK